MMRLAVIAIVLLGAAAASVWWWFGRPAPLPEWIAVGNGRIEADEIHVATKHGGLVAEVLVREGDLVDKGQVVARMDTAELKAQHAGAEAEAARARESVAAAKALIAQRQSELKLATQELERATFLFQRGHIAAETVDLRQSQRATARAALDAATAQLAAAEHAVNAALAAVRRYETLLNDAVLVAPVGGRVLYRLAEPGEVLAAGGRVVTVLNLTEVYMTIFLPTEKAGRVFVGADARIVLDAYPQYVLPAKVSFVSPESQFTPREVETRTEREKLMFRTKVKLPPDLLRKYLERVRTGLPGEAFVLLDDKAGWPDRLAVKLP
jgi:HlyD family secretion protein